MTLNYIQFQLSLLFAVNLSTNIAVQLPLQ